MEARMQGGDRRCDYWLCKVLYITNNMTLFTLHEQCIVFNAIRLAFRWKDRSRNIAVATLHGSHRTSMVGTICAVSAAAMALRTGLSGGAGALRGALP